ncbi:SusC/RagA family TonB-linked outer membrane protein [Salegentibacter maritimus]|uniref:SusC/RagA family TonB-linked outer membrane protein n=1 Tax=Salegentibacter maritimus TaxID=2794347 RepID=UPI0018E4A685|nr:TonB-dependent receptor [Salegentibacter maritimus]MBI6118014.1 TonB-dependent receptor [Salegentibacter maritimus]
MKRLNILMFLCLLMTTCMSLAQQVKLEGRVSDTSSPLPGATVMEKGTSNAVSTDFDGNFELTTNSSNPVLVISFVGYKTKEHKVTNNSFIDITLEMDTQSLEQIVVVGYGKKKKVNLSGAVAQVEDEYFKSRPITNAGSALQGAIGNLNVNNSSGQPGASPDFNIRGYESISGGSPLIVIDGVPTSTQDFNLINPNDIASVSVLKDAASAAIYGSRASFGVILITTKEASSNKLKLQVNSNFSFRSVTNLPEIVTDPYQVASYRDVMASPFYDLYSDNALEYAQQVSNDPDTPNVRLDDRNSNNWQYFAQTDWFDEVYNSYSSTQNHNVTLSQKKDKSSFLLGAEAFKQEGMLKYNNDIYNRYNLRSKLNFNVTDWLTIGNNTWFNANQYDEPTANAWLFFHNVNRQPSLTPLFNPDGSPTSGYANTIGALETGNKITKERTFFTKFNAQLDLIKDKFFVNADASFRRKNKTNETYQVPLEYKSGPNNVSRTRNNSYASFYSLDLEQNNYNIYATYTNTFNKAHYLNAIVGYNQEEFFNNYKDAYKNDLISEELPTVNLATGTSNASQDLYSWATQGLFYRLNYIFKDKYIVETNGRYDGSSRFPKKDRWAFNPSVSAGWIISKENFFNDETFFNLLKVRGSYGSLGNQNINDVYPYIPSLSTQQTSAILNGERPTSVISPGLVSSTLTWETVTTLNAGIDMGLFSNKLNVGFDWYRRYTKDMLTQGKDLPSVLGTNEPLENAADLVTKGWETEISWKDQFKLGGDDFRYNVRFNLADNRTFIEKFDNPAGSLNKYYVGKEIGEIWGLTTLGYFQSNEEVSNSPNQTAVASYPSQRPIEAGDIKFADLNGDGEINGGEWTLENHGDYKLIGNSTPRYTFGLDLNANWNNFDLRMFFQGVGKRDWYPGAGNHYFWGIYAQPWASVTQKNLDHWTPENPNAYFPRPKSYVAETNKELGISQTKYLQDAAYIRMKNITLGYTVPKGAFKNTSISNVRIYLSGENLFEITNLYEYLDPEILGSTTAYPFQKTYSVGASINF